MKILSNAEEDKDIMSLEMVRGLIEKIKANTVPSTNTTIDSDYKLGTDVQTSLDNLLTYAYINASGIKQLSDSIKSITDYTGGAGIVVSGSVISHSNNLSSEGTVNTGEIQTPDFGENANIMWFKYDKQGHVTFTGSGGIKIPSADKTLSASSTRPISSKAVYDSLTASVIRATARTVGTGNNSVSIHDDVQETLEGFQSHIYKLHTDITSLANNVVSLNTYKDSIDISAGSTTVPVYFKNGVPTACQYTLGSICTKSTGDYLPITGGTLTGNLTVNSDVVISSNKSTTENSIPFSGSISISDFTDLKNFKSIVGTAINSNTSIWYNVISVRQRNGYGDGSNYGMYLYTKMTEKGSLYWNKQTSASSYQGERVILDSGNYTSYFTVDTELKTGSANPIQNAAVTSKFNSLDSDISATNSVVSSLSNSLNSAFNKFADYLPLTGGKLTGNLNIGSDESLNDLTVYGDIITYSSVKTCGLEVGGDRDIGSNTEPIYLSGGTFHTCKYTLGDACEKGVKTSTSKTHTNYGTNNGYVPDVAFLSNWNGAYDSSGNSNLTYCYRGTFGTACVKNTVDDVIDGNENLVTSKAVYNALQNYLPLTGNASTATKATKLATSRTISLSGGLNGSTSFDGSSNATIKGSLKRCYIYDDNSNYSSYPWRKVAETTITQAYVDTNITFLVSCSYNNKSLGILRARIRSDSVGKFYSGDLQWDLLVSDDTYINPDNFVMVYTATQGTSLKAEIWVKNPARYNGYMFTVFDESSGSDFIDSWTLYSNSTRCSSYTSGTGVIKSTVLAIKNNAESATALTSSAGSSTNPVYFSNGKPVACSYTLGSICTKSASDYATASHTHSGYATASHTHSGYASSSHSHTSEVSLYESSTGSTSVSVNTSSYLYIKVWVGLESSSMTVCQDLYSNDGGVFLPYIWGSNGTMNIYKVSVGKTSSSVSISSTYGVVLKTGGTISAGTTSTFRIKKIVGVKASVS